MKNTYYPVKVFTLILLAFAGVNSSNAQAVLTGGIKSNFGVDGDVESDTSRNGSAASSSNSYGLNGDDWFKFKTNGSGVQIIDTSGAYGIKAAVAAYPGGVGYIKQMIYDKSSVVHGNLLLDGVFGMDKSGGNGDSIYGPGSDALGGPSTWSLKGGNATGKSDIIDFASHVRRQGPTIDDSLWMFLAMSFKTTTGTKEGTMELFVNDVQYDNVSGAFQNYGNEEGRVAWRFNSAGQVIKAGDMAISWAYNPSSGAFTVDPMIWVADSNRNSGAGASYHVPSNFSYSTGTGAWNPNTNYGYQRIQPKSGTSFAYANAGVAGQKAPPFSTINSGGNASTTYDANQTVEFGMNMTQLGVDPANYDAIDDNPCDVSFRTIIYRTTTAGSFTGALKDNAGPYPFWRNSVLANNSSDTLKCNKASLDLQIPGNFPAAYYNWTALPGTAEMGSINLDSSMTVTKPGKYLLEYATLACEIHFDTITVLQDITKPIANATGIIDTLSNGSLSAIFIFGGDSAASVAAMAASAPTFGPHQSFIWSWEGPGGFTSSNRLLSFDSTGLLGNYLLTLTETRNGCTDTAMTLFSFLPVEYGNFNCSKTPEGVQLNWETFSERYSSHFNVEKWNGSSYQVIGRIEAQGNSASTVNYVFVDRKPSPGPNVYRVGLNTIGESKVSYTQPCVANVIGRNSNLPFVFNVYPNPGTGEFTVTSALNASANGTVFLYDMSGRIIKSETLTFDGTGMAKLDLSEVTAGVYMLGMVNSELPQTVKVTIK